MITQAVAAAEAEITRLEAALAAEEQAHSETRIALRDLREAFARVAPEQAETRRKARCWEEHQRAQMQARVGASWNRVHSQREC